jgi:uncharacterized protein (TIGR02466 family)
MELTVNEALQKGVAEHNLGNLEEAERIYGLILQIQPRHPDGCHNLGRIALSSNQLEKAVALFKVALESDSSVDQFWLSYIEALLRVGDNKDAKRAIKKAKKKGVDRKKLEMLVATPRDFVKTKEPLKKQLNDLLEYYQHGRYEAAEKLAKSILNASPKQIFPLKMLGSVYKAMGRYTEAVQVGQKAVAISPNDAEVHYNLGNTFEKLARFDDARVCYIAALAVKADFAEAYSNLGSVYQKLGRLSDAEESYTKAITLKPDFTEALKNRWLLRFDSQEFLSALKDADRLVTFGYKEKDLITLYALEDIEEIHNRIEMRAIADAEDLNFAAFTAFIYQLTGKKASNNFCPYPLDFIHRSNLAAHLKDPEEFIFETIQELEEIPTIWEPSGKSTSNGFQSRQDINLFKTDSEKLSRIKRIITKELEAYKHKFRDKPCSYIQKWPLKSSVFGWHVILKKQGYQEPHIHSSGWVSGVIYLKVVPSLGKNEGAIEFSLNGPNYHHSESPQSVIQPEVGDMVLFPSSLHHRTIPFSTESERIIVSFDLMPKHVES